MQKEPTSSTLKSKLETALGSLAKLESSTQPEDNNPISHLKKLEKQQKEKPTKKTKQFYHPLNHQTINKTILHPNIQQILL